MVKINLPADTCLSTKYINFVHMLRQTVKTFIEDKALFFPNQKVLVALSGGADSVALLRILSSMGYACEAAHCNFLLRGEESDRDEEFVRRLCEEQQIPLHVIRFDTVTYAQTHRLSIEMAARELRYHWFEQLRKEIGADVIALAHHRDDSVETVLLNLIRGTGINGLRGIPAKNGYIVRPLLNVSRTEILEYLKRLEQEYVTDSTNLENKFVRNKIRLEVLPLLREINPSVSEKIAETANHLSESAVVCRLAMQEAVRRTLVKDEPEEKIMDIPLLWQEVSPSSVLFEFLSPLGFNTAQIKEICDGLHSQSGKLFLSEKWKVLRDRTQLVALKKEYPSIEPQLVVKIVDKDSSFCITSDKEIAYLDADKLHLPLKVRRWERGDKFIPFGMTGKKKVSDYLTDRKFSLFRKEGQYVACSGEDIVWLIGERIDHRFRITDQTRRVLILRLSEQHDSV